MSFAAKTHHLQEGQNKWQKLFTHLALHYHPREFHNCEEPGWGRAPGSSCGWCSKEEAGGLPLELQVSHCPVLALKKRCAAGNEMDYQGLGLGEGTADPLSHFAMNRGVSCDSFAQMPALVIAFQLPIVLVEQHGLYFAHAGLELLWDVFAG